MTASLTGQPVIVGAGLAGMLTALSLDQPCVLLSQEGAGTVSSSVLAQGGVAVAIGADDSLASHLADTLAAGDGLCNRHMAEAILAQGPAALQRLIRLGVVFDTDAAGGLLLGLEAAHQHKRIVHARGDGTGAEIVRALAAAVRATPRINVLEGWTARRLLLNGGRVAGVLAATPEGANVLRTEKVVLACGGLGSLFAASTNPQGSIGGGLALAARAGAVIADPEMVQFHPTALDIAAFPLPLVSEAVRGEGAVLVNDAGERFMADIAGQELAPRDVVARHIHEQILQGRGVFLDARQVLGEHFSRRFPAIAARCTSVGLDPSRDLIPVRPAAHYHMGGVAVDLHGRSSVSGLWAVGEVASTGLHGANRLASNSLLEAAVLAPMVAGDVAAAVHQGLDCADAEPLPVEKCLVAVRSILTREAGLSRTETGLSNALRALEPLVASSDAALTGLLLVAGALERRESRGAHWRADYPMPGEARRTFLTMQDAISIAGRSNQPAMQMTA
ncbi:L-aspartate oxidase [Aureimonas fodinaquatilis]|uniref:L-aspartate oxidase n=1 Tax=Aureimonas fodinaquatilis TaxID=2565783 RepID=A0A5B0DZ65_9HYPH|nr:L-aspartate oxidase [Aureimonas fodinaquatilis]KAA0972094.1 L-aspartate oxidase [Aureimonas fodinaquatilis]